MPDDKALLELIEMIGTPIIATSCNLVGESPAISIEQISPKIEEKVSIIVDGGKSKIGTPSTIIKVEGKDINILREGPISKEQILKSIKDS